MFSWLSSQFSWLKISLVFFHGKGGSPSGGSRQRRRAARALAGGGAGASGPGPWGPGFAAPTRRMWVTWRPDGIWWQCNIWNQAIMVNINPISPNLRCFPRFHQIYFFPRFNHFFFYFPDFTIFPSDLTQFIFSPELTNCFKCFFRFHHFYDVFFMFVVFQVSPIWRCFFPDLTTFKMFFFQI